MSGSAPTKPEPPSKVPAPAPAPAPAPVVRAPAAAAREEEGTCATCGAKMLAEFLADHQAACKGAASSAASTTSSTTSTTTATTTAAAAAAAPGEIPGWPKGAVDTIAAVLPAAFPRSKIEETLRAYPTKGDVDAVIALMIASAEAPRGAPKQPEPTDWPKDAVDSLAQNLPPTFPRQKIEEMMKAYPTKGDMDGLLALLFATADAANAPKATDPDPETLKLIMEASVPEKDCILCLDTFPVTQMYTVDCPSAHRFCFDCIARYLEMCIKDNLAAVCPAPKNTCQHVLGENELFQVASSATGSSLTREKVAKYNEQMLMRAIKSIPGIIGCPTAGCGNWVIPSDTRKKERCHCQACNAVFCSLCKKLYHFHCNCDDVAKFTERWVEWSTSGRRRYNRDKAEAIAKIETQRAALERRNAELRKKYTDMLSDEQYKAANGRHCPKASRVTSSLSFVF